MKFKFIIFIILILSCKETPKSLRVDKYFAEKGFEHFSRVNAKLLETKIYDKHLRLVLKNEYSRVGCNIVDSSVIIYNLNNLVAEIKHYRQIGSAGNCKSIFELHDNAKFVYTKMGILNKIRYVNGDSSYIDNLYTKGLKSPLLNVKDSLLLLRPYLSELKFVINTTVPKYISKKYIGNLLITQYKFNDVPSILMDYGIPGNEVLEWVRSYTKDNALIKDEFRFNNYLVTRSYVYRKDILSKVFIKTRNFKSGHETMSIEYFDFKQT